jgi:hypothetical protein
MPLHTVTMKNPSFKRNHMNPEGQIPQQKIGLFLSKDKQLQGSLSFTNSFNGYEKIPLGIAPEFKYDPTKIIYGRPSLAGDHSSRHG